LALLSRIAIKQGETEANTAAARTPQDLTAKECSCVPINIIPKTGEACMSSNLRNRWRTLGTIAIFLATSLIAGFLLVVGIRTMQMSRGSPTDDMGEFEDLKSAGYVTSLAFSPDGKVLASGSIDKTVRLWDIAGSKQLATLQGHVGRVYSVAFSPDGTIIASGSDDKTIRLWDADSQKNVATLNGSSDRFSALAFSPDGKTIASGGEGNTASLWSVATGKTTLVLHGHTSDICSVAFSPDGNMLASGAWDHRIIL
jgi:WD40 repeat protein